MWGDMVCVAETLREAGTCGLKYGGLLQWRGCKQRPEQRTAAQNHAHAWRNRADVPALTRTDGFGVGRETTLRRAATAGVMRFGKHLPKETLCSSGGRCRCYAFEQPDDTERVAMTTLARTTEHKGDSASLCSHLNSGSRCGSSGFSAGLGRRRGCGRFPRGWADSATSCVSALPGNRVSSRCGVFDGDPGRGRARIRRDHRDREQRDCRSSR
jgi:hypothetical protein